MTALCGKEVVLSSAGCSNRYAKNCASWTATSPRPVLGQGEPPCIMEREFPLVLLGLWAGGL